jgi:hypothetical protein
MRALILPVALICLAAPAGAAPGWTPLFNGRNLDNFDIAYSSKPVDGRPASAMFEVKNGVVHTYPGQAAGTLQPSAYFQTRDARSNYVLHLEYKWGDKKFAPRMARVKDAGIVFHIYENASFSWPRGIEAQIEDSNVADLWIISSRADVTVKDATYKPKPDPLQDGQPHFAPDGDKRTFGDHGQYVRVRHAADFEHAGWNSVDIVVRGDSATYLVNGQVDMCVTNLKKWSNGQWERLDSGKILFQAEFAEVSYRNIKIRPVMESDPR